MQSWRFCLLYLLCLGLFACADEPSQKKETPETGTSSVVQSGNSADVPMDEAMGKPEKAESDTKILPDKDDAMLTPLSPEEAKMADRLISFSNQARDILRRGTYAAETALADNARHYRETWTLRQRPKLPARHTGDARLKAPQGIFNAAEEAQLTASLDRMDKALNNIIDHYRALEKYVADSTIRDDGKKGLELSEKLAQGHEEFMQARRSWMEIVERRADEAEARLLREHPLQRQILSAKNIFAQMDEIGNLVAADPNDRAPVSSVRQNLNNIISEAAKPPFQASPALERLYRNFLKEAQSYSQILDRALLEGFHNVQRRELNKAMLKCGEAYNEFVRAANTLSDQREKR